MDRIHVAVRLAIFVGLGTIGTASFCSLLYVILPAIVALLIAQKGSARYLLEDVPLIVRGLRWVTRAYAYLWLLTDVPPTSDRTSPHPIDVDVDTNINTASTPGSALLRVIYSLPASILLAIMLAVAHVLWVVGAIAILVTEQPPKAITDFMIMMLRYQMRLVAYHLSVVDTYPSFEDVSAHTPPTSTSSPAT